MNGLFKRSDWPLWVFLVCLSSGVITAPNKAVAFHRYLELSTTAFLLYHVGKALMSMKQYRRLVMAVVGLCAGMVALCGIWYMVWNRDSTFFIASMATPDFYHPFQQEYTRTFHPTILGNSLALSSICAWYPCRYGNSVTRAVGWVALVLCLIGVLMPWWRGTPWVFAVAWATVWLLGGSRRVPRPLVIFALMGMVLIGVLFPSSKFDLGQTLSGQSGFFSAYRATRLHLASLMFKGSPAFGVGFDQYRARFDDYARFDDDAPHRWHVRRTPNDLKVADNMYATLLAETGLVGLGGFLLFAGVLLGRGLRAARRVIDDEHRTCIVLSIAIVLGFLVSMLGYELFYWPTPFMMLSFTGGWLAGLTKERMLSGRVAPVLFEGSETPAAASDATVGEDDGNPPTRSSVMIKWLGGVAIVCGVGLAAVSFPTWTGSPTERYDAWGFRNAAVPTEADVVALGSSLTYGNTVAREHTWHQQLARLARLTTYNMAFHRYGAVHGLMLLKRSLTLRPRFIVQALYSGSDFYHAYRLVYGLGGMPQLKTDDPQLLERLQAMDQKDPLREKLRQLKWDDEQALRAQSWSDLARAVKDRSGYLAVETQRIRTILTPAYRLAFLDGDDPRVQEGIRISLDAIAQAHQQLGERGVGYFVLLIPTKELVYRDLVSSGERSAVYTKLIQHEERVLDQAKTFFARQGIPTVDALPVLRAGLRNGESPYYFTPDGQFNATGHRLMAELVLVALRTPRLPETHLQTAEADRLGRTGVRPDVLLTGAISGQSR